MSKALDLDPVHEPLAVSSLMELLRVRALI